MVLKYRHSDGSLCIKVTDDLVVSIHFFICCTLSDLLELIICLKLHRVYADCPLGLLFCISFRNQEPHSRL